MNFFTVSLVIKHLFIKNQAEVKLISVCRGHFSSLSGEQFLAPHAPSSHSHFEMSFSRQKKKGERQRGKNVAEGGKAVGRWEGEGKEWGQPAELGAALTLPPHGPHPAGKHIPISIPLFFFQGQNNLTQLLPTPVISEVVRGFLQTHVPGRETIDCVELCLVLPSTLSAPSSSPAGAAAEGRQKSSLGGLGVSQRRKRAPSQRFTQTAQSFLGHRPGCELPFLENTQ